MSKSKKEKVEPYNIWIDPKTPAKEMSPVEFGEYLKAEYGIDPKKMKGLREMIMHVDGDTWFSYQWKWTIDGKEFFQSTRQNRTGMNAHIWADHGE